MFTQKGFDRFTVEEQRAIFAAQDILHRGLQQQATFTAENPEVTKLFLVSKLGAEPVEKFCALFLDHQLRLIEYAELFTGTVGQTAVYPREILRAAMRTNAANVVIAHNHPSGDTTPSRPDIVITAHIQEALRLIDVELLDHMIVGWSNVYSFSEHGRLPC